MFSTFATMEYAMKVSDFSELCKKHDITYHYSDDHRIFRRGSAQYAQIMENWHNVDGGPEVATAVWNYWVFMKFNGTDFGKNWLKEVKDGDVERSENGFDS